MRRGSLGLIDRTVVLGAIKAKPRAAVLAVLGAIKAKPRAAVLVVLGAIKAKPRAAISSCLARRRGVSGGQPSSTGWLVRGGARLRVVRASSAALTAPARGGPGMGRPGAVLSQAEETDMLRIYIVLLELARDLRPRVTELERTCSRRCGPLLSG